MLSDNIARNGRIKYIYLILCTSQYAITQFLYCTCSNEVKCSLLKSFCTTMYYCPLCCKSTSSSVKGSSVP